MGWKFEVLELISKRQKDIGTKCSWDIWLLGLNVVGTFGIWAYGYVKALCRVELKLRTRKLILRA